MSAAIVVTARATFARVQTVIDGLRQSQVPLDIVLAGSACEPGYGDLRPDLTARGLTYTAMPTLLSARSDWGMSQTTALSLLHLSQWIEERKPSTILVTGDRYEILATAIAARYQRIRLVHLLGGEVSGNVDDHVRNAVTQLADVHCVPTPHAKARLLAAGIDAASVHLTGCPSVDLVRAARWEAVSTLPGTGADLDLAQPYGVVLWHPVTTHQDTMEAETWALIRSVEAVGVPLVWLWPNVDAGSSVVSKTLRQWRERGPAIPVHFVTHLPAVQFLAVLDRSVGLIGNSSVGVRECGALGVRVVNLGDRQQGRLTGSWVRSLDAPDAHEIRSWWSLPKLTPSTLYGDGMAGWRVAEVIRRVL